MNQTTRIPFYKLGLENHDSHRYYPHAVFDMRDYFLIQGIIIHCQASNVRELTGHIIEILSFGKEKDNFCSILEDRKRPIDGKYSNEVMNSREDFFFLIFMINAIQQCCKTQCLSLQVYLIESGNQMSSRYLMGLLCSQKLE